MTFAEEAARLGRKPLYIVELDLDYCSLTYGTSPCAASVPTTGAQKCFNCFKTCQDKANYDKTTKTYKFISNQSFLPIGDAYFPCITDVDISPTQLKLNDLSIDCSVVVTLQDFAHHDRGIDKYISDRDYDPMEQGTFFGKLHARNQYVQNRVMRVKEAYIDDSRQIHSITQTFLLDRIERPDAKGRVKIYGKGLLRFLHEGGEKAPYGSATLATSLTASQGAGYVNLTFDDPTLDEFGPQGSVASANVVIGDEAIGYNTRTGNLLTSSFPNARGLEGTTIAAHDAGAKVRPWLRFTGLGKSRFPDILEYLLVTCGGVDASFIDKAAWDAETDAKFTHANLKTNRNVRFLKENLVKDLVKEICESVGMTIWYDPYSGKILLKVVDGVGDAPLWDDAVILAGSLSWKEIEKERFTQVRFFFNEIGDDDFPDANSSKYAFMYVDTDAEGANAYNSSMILEIGTRWINDTNAMTEVAQRMLAIHGNLRREIKCKVDARHATPKIGDYVDVKTTYIQGFDGAALTIRCIVSEKIPSYSERGSHYDYKLVQVVKDPDGEA